MTQDCRNPAAARNQRTLTCYECGDQGHYRSDCPELKNQNHGNQAEGTRARGVVHALGGGETDEDPNNIEDETEVKKRSLVVMTIGLDIPKQIVNAQTGAQKPDNLKHEDVGDHAILTVLNIVYHAILTVLNIVYHAILTVLDIVYHAILTVLNIVYHAILTVLDIVYHAILTVLDIIMPPKKTPRTRTTTTNTTSVTNAQLQAMINQGVIAALAAHDANRSTNGEDSHNSGTGVRRTERVARECTYQDFMKCQPLFFKGTEGVVELTQWFKRMETVFRISNCIVENQIKFSTCTLLGVALTWWNSHVRTVGHDVAYAMTWTDLKKKMTDKYCPRSEIKKLEVELWNLKVKGTDVLGYNQRFQELALLCVRMFSEESDKIEKYVGGLPDMIHGSVMASRPKTMQDAIEMATELMDKKISTLTERQAENKRKLDNNSQAQQQSPKRQMWLKLTPLGLVKGRSMLELFHCATGASCTTMGHVL
ncbi:reverse transcriptase domain-containing protein [Tanacetum coccineum]